ncbi:TetR/AcrR family transcriptional regulator [Geomicrobium sediminis]|uniref:AcrR family transcriptional regulator n=1 Tax=Geomicrobium sediminis TaxID=1347788 RepID=A0ABS2PAM8_9BACL|nr:TetR/AcrR family transcriptional regulator [Geomicrobium sediminis]MBM7632352.1 AcrR family transcriptional regulator [Geomicrobium sediminis]
MVKHDDRRVKYTKLVLKESLLQLLNEKSILDITVTELCKRADINRNTFYTHYQSPHELLRTIDNTFTNTFISKVEKSMIHGNYHQLFYNLCLHLQDNKELCLTLICNGKRDLLTNIISYFKEDIVEKWKQQSSMDQSKVELLYTFVSGGSVSVLEEWIRTDFQKKPELVADEIKEILVVINKKFINKV